MCIEGLSRVDIEGIIKRGRISGVGRKGERAVARMETDKLAERMILRYRDIQRKKDDREKD